MKNEWRKVRIDPDTGKLTQLKSGSGYPEEVISRLRRTVNFYNQIPHQTREKSEEEARLKVFNLRRNSELIYKFLMGKPFEEAVDEKSPCNIPFESKYYTNYLEMDIEFGEKSRKSKSPQIKIRPSSLITKKVQKNKEGSVQSKGEKDQKQNNPKKIISIASISTRSLKPPMDYRVYRDRNDQEVSPLPSIKRDIPQERPKEFEEAIQICNKLQEKLQKDNDKENFDQNGRLQYREISNLNCFNYVRDSSKEYARKKDVEKFKAHRKDIASSFEKVLKVKTSD